ncbi:hypothetical protein HPP92_016593 [Vanilla planifolia]|uniref:RING-type E3 ubiquitin transferase n=1 Tax=Vanilla planifolia TaxID=51239 RepID=A0A835QJL5_VANPL|nr:hypothetical protein HPP92_016593 [Vanilla planifolia]
MEDVRSNGISSIQINRQTPIMVKHTGRPERKAPNLGSRRPSYDGRECLYSNLYDHQPAERKGAGSTAGSLSFRGCYPSGCKEFKMRASGSQLRASGVKGDTTANSQLVAVAVDGDKSSQHALKWAADHIVSKNKIFILLHVRRKVNTIPTPSGLHIPIADAGEDVYSAILEQIDLQTRELLLPFQCFCSRRGLQCKEVILDATDTPKAIVDFILYHAVDKLVLGSSSRNVFIRKISSVRPATRPKMAFVNNLQELDTFGNRFQSVKSTPEVGQNFGPPGRSADIHGFRNAVYERVYDNRPGESIGIKSNIGVEYSYRGAISCPSPSRVSSEQSGDVFWRHVGDVGGRQMHLSSYLNEYGCSREKGIVLEPNVLDEGNCSSSIGHDIGNWLSNGSIGNDWTSGTGSNGLENRPPVPPTREAGPRLNHSTEWIESEMSRLKLDLKQVQDLHEESAKEKCSRTWPSEALKGASFAEEVVNGPDAAPRMKPKLPLHESAQASKLVSGGNSAENMNDVWLEEIAEKRKELEAISSDIRYRRYSVEEILNATDNFSDSLKIGEGGYGPVFKSTLDHTLVAIKILRSDVTQGVKQFQKEVEVLSSIRHPNMVLLMGACPEFGCLVYEYMSNGSLEDRLFCEAGSPPLSWQLRFKIAAEIATGLLFLHQTKPEPLVHRDLKPGNVLLDSNFVCKIADVGLARLIPPTLAGATQYHMTAAAGTFCYIDPEYQKSGLVSTKSDIYALGVILLQLLTAKPPMGLAHNIENAMEMGHLEQMLDPNVPNWPLDQAMKLATIGLHCAELRRRDRPDLATVVLPKLNELRAFAESTLQPVWTVSPWSSMSLRDKRSSVSGLEEVSRTEIKRGAFSH